MTPSSVRRGGLRPALRVADLQLRGTAGPLRTRLYWPPPTTVVAVPALLVFFHTGAVAAGRLGSTDTVCRALCTGVGIVVLAATCRPSGSDRRARHGPADLAPGGRSVPDDPYPVAFHDATIATEWAADHAAELDADPGRLLVAGQGTGGGLAAAVARYARDHGWPTITRQVLIHPYEDPPPGGPPAYDPYLLPLSSPTAAGVAPATVVTAGRGPLHDQGRRYAERLRRAGVGVDELKYEHPARPVTDHDGAAGPMLTELTRMLRRGLEPHTSPATTTGETPTPLDRDRPTGPAGSKGTDARR